MLRRLHLDEASRALHLKAPSKDGQNQENNGESELALEFSRLLDQVQGPVAAAHDEVMALGLALAQAIPLVQQKSERVDQRDDHRDPQRQEQDAGAQDSEISFDDAQDSQGSARYTLENRESAVAEGPKMREASASNVQVKQSEDESDGDERKIADSVSVGPELVVEEEDLEGQLAATAVEDVSAEVEVTGQSEAVVAVVQQAADVGGPQVEQELQTVEVKAALQQFRLADNQQDSSEDEQDEGDGLDQEFTSSSEVMANADEVAARQVKLTAGKSAAESGEPSEMNPTAAGAQASSSQSGESSSLRDLRRVSEEARPGLEQPRVSKQRESLSKLSQAVKVEVEHTAGQFSSEQGKGAAAAFDAAFQITLLRQAFESLRANKPEGENGKQRSTASQVVATAGLSETKSAAHEPSARGAKQLPPSHARRMLERVESTLKEAARSRDGKTISLRLDPANLGKVKVDVSLREGALHARLTPENKQVLTALREHAPELQSALRKLGLNVDSVTVTVSSEGGQDLSDFGRELNNGKSFQEQRNNLPNEDRQVAENSFGSELAEPRAVGPQPAEKSASDHWVA